MTVRELIRELLDHLLDSQVYVGKGMGPLGVVDDTATDKIYVVLSPGTWGREGEQ